MAFSSPADSDSPIAHFCLSEHATRQWATLAREWYGYELGKDSEQVAGMQALIDNPRQYPAWASKNHMEVGDLQYGS